MKFRRIFTMLAGAGLCLAVDSSPAQAVPPLEPAPAELIDTSNLLPPIIDLLPKALPPIAERPLVIPPLSLPEVNLPAAPERPLAPDRPVLAPGVKDLVKDFQTARQDFLSGQQELLRQLKTATQEQRAALREQLKENLEAWREAQKAHLEDLREQAKEIINSVPDIREVIDAGRGEGRGR